ncbi:ABC transporter ATP-binding protein [Caldalkalibacillus mannanilyticus]|uniref:ABC transporter ATP-binding protein n=1 Tax=Caldalkalibacillus mannanilyticus TaxID=1418 RepID=UPI0004692A07|nr:ABC transporter ATP-binding protein [Caldalkalibacillus mannanilyticus]
MKDLSKEKDVVLHLDHVSIEHRPKKKGALAKPLLQEINLKVKRGEWVGLVGESGSGKSLTATSVARLLPDSMNVTGGQILFQGENLLQRSEKEMRKLRGRQISYIFQDYTGSLTPFLKIGSQMIETLQAHERLRKKEAKELVLDALNQVDLPAQRIYNSYPFQLSGGQRQRVAIALALMLKPALLIADEPTTALDVVVGERIMDQLLRLQDNTGCGILFITHDLNILLNRAQHIAVMYGGRIVEQGSTADIAQNSQHPYTQYLLQAKPTRDQLPDRLTTIPGEPGLVAQQGCPFALRCPMRVEACEGTIAPASQLNSQHVVSCHLLTESLEQEAQRASKKEVVYG